MKKQLVLLSVVLSTVVSGAAQNSIIIKSVPFILTWDGLPLAHTASENSITITAGKETDLYCFVDGSYYVNTAPKILFSPDADFILTARITPEFKSLYDGGAIMVYSDSLNWAKLLFERHEDGSFGLGSSLVSEKRGDDSYHTTVAKGEVYVKVARSGSIFNFYYSHDGRKWNLLRTFPYRKFENLRIGFYAQSPKGERCTVTFSDITYANRKFENFFTGE